MTDFQAALFGSLAIILVWAICAFAILLFIHHSQKGHHASPLDESRVGSDDERHTAHGDDPQWSPRG